MIPSELLVLLDGKPVGTIRRAAGDRLSFIYHEEWRRAPAAYPLSLSMPMLEREHQDEVIRPYLEGLLPDRPEVLDSWGRGFHVSGKNAYGLLAHVGEDCPGAVQFLRPDRYETADPEDPEPQWLTEEGIAKRLENSIDVYNKGAPVRGLGYFSLAGAQPKIVLYREGDQWAVPNRVWGSTHILKPPAQDLEQFALNEHLCMVLADELRIPVAKSEIHSFGDQVAIVVERFDRVPTPARVVRRHQEDFCQALGVRPATKYESEGGPGAVRCAQLIMQSSADPDADLATFVDALAFNWIILGTDGHAKNYALLFGSARPTLAPLYDIISLLPYPGLVYPGKAKLAMRIGSEYRVRWVRRRHWEALADQIGIDRLPLLDRVGALVEEIPSALDRTRDRISNQGLETHFSDRLLAEVESQLDSRRSALQ